MSYDVNDKLDLLWKRYRGVSPTSNTKAAHNEAVTSVQPTFQQNFWTDSDRIPLPAPDTSTVTGNELWATIVEPKKAANAVQLVVDQTANLTAYHAMSNPATGVVEANRIRNWVPPVVDRSYSIRVWAGKPGDATVNPQRMSPVAEGFEWEFDYATGVLFFPNEVPPLAKQNGIWIEGWVYIGELGRSGNSASNANTSKIRTLTFTTGSLGPGTSVDFTLETGGKCILVEAKVSGPSTLECHAVSSRTDTNPYRFVAINAHLIDDGSYVINGNRFFGERFVPLINMEDTTSTVTYWRVQNNLTTNQVITVIVKVA